MYKFLEFLFPENPEFCSNSLELSRFGGSEREFPRCPSKEGDDDKERYNGVGSKAITGTPEEVELEDEEHDDGDSNVEAGTVTSSILDVRTRR